MDIAFIVDASGSINPKNYQLQKDFIKNVAEENGISENGTRIAVVVFSQTASVPIKFNDYYDVKEFVEGVQLLNHEQSITRMDRGFKVAYDKLFTKGYGSRYVLSSPFLLLYFIYPYLAVLWGGGGGVLRQK